MGSVDIERGDLPELDIQRALAVDASVVILPLSRSEDGRGIYGEATLFLTKELRLAGRWRPSSWTPRKWRLFEVKKSALAAAPVTISLGIVSAAGWDAVKALLRREHASDSPMEITYTDLTPERGGRTWTVRGSSEHVIEAIDNWRSEPGDEECFRRRAQTTICMRHISKAKLTQA